MSVLLVALIALGLLASGLCGAMVGVWYGRRTNPAYLGDLATVSTLLLQMMRERQHQSFDEEVRRAG